MTRSPYLGLQPIDSSMSALNRLLCGAGTCGDLLACVYNLNKLESDAYFALLSGPVRMDELAVALGKDRSTVYRALQKLVGLQLATRDTVSLTGGGYCHIYTPVNPDAVARRVEEWREEFSRTLSSALDGFRLEAMRRQNGAAIMVPSRPRPDQ